MQSTSGVAPECVTLWDVNKDGRTTFSKVQEARPMHWTWTGTSMLLGSHTGKQTLVGTIAGHLDSSVACLRTPGACVHRQTDNYKQLWVLAVTFCREQQLLELCLRTLVFAGTLQGHLS